MRVVKLFHQVAMRFSEMDPSEGEDLYVEAKKAYDETLASAKEKTAFNARNEQEAIAAKAAGKTDFKAKPPEKLTKMEQAVTKSELWFARYGFAFLYIIIVPMIRKYMEGGGVGEKDEKQEMEDMMRFYSMYRRNKNS